MKVFIVTAEHFTVPGIVVHAHASRESAVSEAVDLTNVMLKDNGWQPLASPIQWEHHVERLQEQHGAAHCYVEILETELCGEAPATEQFATKTALIAALRWALDKLPDDGSATYAGAMETLWRAEGRAGYRDGRPK